MNDPIRVAQIMGKMKGGGVEAFVMNYFRHMDRNRISFDFISFRTDLSPLLQSVNTK